LSLCRVACTNAGGTYALTLLERNQGDCFQLIFELK